jgi:hypothetical protein
MSAERPTTAAAAATRPRFVVTLQPVDDHMPAEERLAGALKDVLRRHRLRCLSVEPVGPPPPPTSPAATTRRPLTGGNP